MTGALDRLASPLTGAATSQGTVIEQSRAVAEAMIAAEMAKRFPRDVDRAVREMQAACARPELARVAEYSKPQSGGAVTGPSVHLARELATTWGNITHGVAELRRDPVAGQSELLAFAWDVEKNTRSARTYVVPHVRDKRGGAETLVNQADITNMNNSVAARQLREVIYSVLPRWFWQEAVDLCKATMTAEDRRAGDLKDRLDRAVALFHGNGITGRHLEDYLGRPRPQWSEGESARLRVLWESLRSGETTVADVVGGGGRVKPGADVLADVVRPAAPPADRDEAEPSAAEYAAMGRGGDEDA